MTRIHVRPPDSLRDWFVLNEDSTTNQIALTLFEVRQLVDDLIPFLTPLAQPAPRGLEERLDRLESEMTALRQRDSKDPILVEHLLRIKERLEKLEEARNVTEQMLRRFHIDIEALRESKS